MMLTDMAKYMAKKMMMWGYKNVDDGVKGCFCGNYATKNGGQADPDEGGERYGGRRRAIWGMAARPTLTKAASDMGDGGERYGGWRRPARW